MATAARARTSPREAGDNGSAGRASSNGHGPPPRIPPFNLQVEQALLGAAILSRDALAVLATRTRPDDFYTVAHQYVARVLVAAFDEEWDGIDVSTLAAELRIRGQLDDVGGLDTLNHMVSTVPATSSARRYAQIILEHAELRSYFQAGEDLTNVAHALDLDGARAIIDRAVGLAAANTITATKIDQSLEDWIDAVEARFNRDQLAAGIPTGYYDLDAYLGGLRAGQLITIAGRPGMGKSQMAQNIARLAASNGHPTLVVSVEMNAEELNDRWISAASRVAHQFIRAGTISDRDWPRIHHAIGQLATQPLWIIDHPTVTVKQIHAAARDIRDLALVIVDYTQLVQSAGKRDNREQEVAEVTRGLKLTARRLAIPVIALAQLNRSLEHRSDKRPTLGDLRESGAIENDSDVVIGLYRDEVYHRDSKDKGIIEAIVLKQRNGPLGTARLGYLPEIHTIANLARQEEL